MLAQAGRYKQACLAWIQTRDKQTLNGEFYRSLNGKKVAASEDGVAASEQQVETSDELLKTYLSQFRSESAIAKAIAKDTSNANLRQRLGAIREECEDWNGAANAYEDAVARSNSHRPDWFYRLGFVLFRAGQVGRACQAFRETRLFRLPYGIDTEKYAKDPEEYRNMQYRESVDVLQVQRRTVLYESTHGAAIGGNPYAIFRHLLQHEDFSGWTHVWVMESGISVPRDLRSCPSVILVEHGSDLYQRYLATASHLINDSTFPYWFTRRESQKYLNTWHGTPLKTLGRSIRTQDEFHSHRNVQRNLLHATHLISPNAHTSDVLMNDFDVRGVCNAKLAETGYPRVDRTLNASSSSIASTRAELGLADDKPVVLYAPTWRGVFGQTELDLAQVRSDLAKLATLSCHLIFRGHPFSEHLLRGSNLPVTVVPQEIDTADVLAVTDILVTDYSSICFDFLPTRRPIFHYCYDLDEYAASRGLYFNSSEMPGSVYVEIDGLIDSIEHTLVAGQSENAVNTAALNFFCPYDDGQATAKTVAFFFSDYDRDVVDRYHDTRPSLLFFAGHFNPNGINASFLNLIYALQETEQYKIAVAIEPNQIIKQPERLEKFNALPPETTVLNRAGRLVVNPEQKWVADRFRSRRWFPSDAMRETCDATYRDEFQRTFGDANVDVAIDFDGYNGLWTNIFGPGASHTANLCWLHNDLYEEYCLKYPNLRTQFTVYSSFDSLISVSKHMAKINQNELAERFSLPPDKFGYCRNIIDASHVNDQAGAPLDDDLCSWLSDNYCFLSMGRLSPEKGQAKLIEAFARAHACNPNLRLVLLGEGPLRGSLEKQIAELGLTRSVYLAGMRSNPFPALKRCDCFVLPSNHEGQPMVLLEALALGKNILATDINGNRGALEDGRYGDLVDNSIDGLETGMLKAISGNLNPAEFSSVDYHNQVISEFKNRLTDALRTR